MGSAMMVRYAEDGTLYYYSGLPPREQALGEYWFADKKLHFVESIAGLDVVGVYSVTVDTENGKPVHLSLSVIEDAAGERSRDYEMGLTRTELPADVVVEDVASDMRDEEADAPTSEDGLSLDQLFQIAVLLDTQRYTSTPPMHSHLFTGAR